ADASKLPRDVRAALVRGLDPDPDKRWPSMDALLAKLSRAGRDRRRAFWLAGIYVAAFVVAPVVGFVALRSGGGGSSCEAPSVDPAAVWPGDAAKVLAAAGRGDIAAEFDRDVGLWRAQRERSCKAPTGQRVAQLTCLDGVLARLDAL